MHKTLKGKAKLLRMKKKIFSSLIDIFLKISKFLLINLEKNFKRAQMRISFGKISYLQKMKTPPC